MWLPTRPPVGPLEGLPPWLGEESQRGELADSPPALLFVSTSPVRV